MGTAEKASPSRTEGSAKKTRHREGAQENPAGTPCVPAKGAFRGTASGRGRSLLPAGMQKGSLSGTGSGGKTLPPPERGRGALSEQAGFSA